MRKLEASVSHEHKCKNSQQTVNTLNPLIYKKQFLYRKEKEYHEVESVWECKAG